MREYLIVKTKEKLGEALYADKDFKIGDVVLILEGELTEHPTRHSIELSEKEHITDKDVGRCLNHSCDPNTVIDKATKTVRAIKPITKGDELTFDYNANETEMATPFKCECGATGATKCQGFIGGRREKNS